MRNIKIEGRISDKSDQRVTVRVSEKSTVEAAVGLHDSLSGLSEGQWVSITGDIERKDGDLMEFTAVTAISALADGDFGDYRVKADAAKHTCWDADDWDGGLSDDCAGCEEAREHKCEFCGYGHAFTSHSDESHLENDDHAPEGELPEGWYVSPHLYDEN